MTLPSVRPHIALAFLLVATATLPDAAAAQTVHPYKQRGRWTTIPSAVWGGAAGKGTHLALVRGQNDTAWVLHYDGHDGNDARLWLAAPNADDALGVDATPTDSNRIFCSGHSALADGRLLVVGGQVVNHTGPKFAYIFDPFAWMQPNHGWTRQADMLVDRRYASATSLADGRVLVTSGQRFFQIITFGGVGSGGSLLNDFGTLNLSDPPTWSGDPTVTRPSAREGHTAVYDGGSGRMWVFGGRDASGPRNDLWGLVRTSVDEGERWGWSTGCDTCVTVRPPARWRHTAVLQADTIVVFGGLDAGGQALGDVWRYIRSLNKWQPLATTGGPRRYGHTAVLVPGRANAIAPNNAPQMFVFGGRDVTGALADSTVWALSLPPSGDGQWRAIEAGPGPPARESHAAVLDGYRQRPGEFPPKRRMYVFSGSGRSGLLNDVWALTRADVSTSALEPWAWSQPAAAQAQVPAPRSGAIAIHDTEWDRTILFGGDTTTTPGGIANDTWAFTMNPFTGPQHWYALPADSVPSPRAGHTAAWHPGQLLARTQERFTTADQSTPPGIWELLDASRKYLPYYPHMFLTRNGKVFFAGNGDDTRSYAYDPATEAWSDGKPSGFVGTFSVMFRPDTVLKTGGSNPFGAGDAAAIAVFDSATSTATWGAVAVPKMPDARAYQNLVLLPTGEVLMNGGEGSGGVARHPRLWNSAEARQWSDTLALEPGARRYHSSAVLLPDGRVLSSGGPPSEFHGTVFWPPYLFNDDGTLATRPVITDLPNGSTIHYGVPTRVLCDTAAAIGIVCLMRPGAITHQADFDQRFVRLAFAVSANNELTILPPATPNRAPPGNYLLFLVKTHSGATDSIPSVARWVRLDSSPALDVDPSPAAAPVQFRLEPAAPNPVTGEATRLHFVLPASVQVLLEVVDLQGRVVRRLADGAYPPGRHALDWNLRDGAGRRVGAGIYWVRMRAGRFEASRKLVVVP